MTPSWAGRTRSSTNIPESPTRASNLHVAIGNAIQLIVNGLSFGGLVFLLAAGLSIIFGLMDVLNLAHGSFYMIGAYTAYTVVMATQNFWLALLVAPALLAVIGAALEMVFFRRLYRHGHLPQVLMTFAFTFAFGAALAGLAGVIAAPEFAIYPGMDANVLILALVVVVIGGLGSIEGALLGAAVIGLGYVIGSTLFPQFAIGLIFALMAAVLIIRPSGLLGRRS